ncbi:hypothetical protein [Dactylosporangium darangshiense]|uniref:Tetracyclin repressor-like C-terminal domain-containing protein n=1 Tax=Dactylosporangium darangshiense TaxID=579108 RepID=A0ABP8DUJ0_9ACTN
MRPAADDDEGDAMFVSACMHGTASILQTPALATLGLRPELLQGVAGHVMRCIGDALERP